MSRLKYCHHDDYIIILCSVKLLDMKRVQRSKQNFTIIAFSIHSVAPALLTLRG